MNRSYKNARLNNLRRRFAANSNARRGIPIDPQQAYARQFNDITPLAAPDIQVYDEPGLVNAVQNAPIGIPYVIELMDDIQLLAPLEILGYTEITLTGGYSLFGADGYETVSVQADAILTLDGITVTHALGEEGRGVSNSGTLTLLSGAIFGNTVIGNGGGVYSLEPVLILGGEISNNTATLSGGGMYIENDSGIPSVIEDCLIYDNTATNGDGGGIYLGGSTPALDITGVTVMTYNTALNGDGGAIWIAHAYLDQLTAGADAVFANNEASEGRFITDGSDILLHNTNILTDTFTNPFAYGYNNFDISYTEGEPFFEIDDTIVFTATKEVMGAPLEANMFEFSLVDDYGMPLEVGFNDALGNIVFPPMVFDTPGTFNFTISEAAAPLGWLLDPSVFPAVVTVRIINDEISATVNYPNGAPQFLNTFVPDDTVVFTGAKVAINAPLVAGMFEFGLFDNLGALIETATNNAFGNIVFPLMAFDVPGTFNFTIRELTGGENGWVTDPTVFPAVVTVAFTDGQIHASVNYPNGEPVFMNTFVPNNTVVFRGAKEATGAQLPAGLFEFGLVNDLNELIATTVNDGFGNIVFPPLAFNAAGTFNFTIRELTGDENGWVADPTVFPAVVTVAFIGGGYHATVDYPNGEPFFSDSFEPEECGLIEFPALTFTAPGVYEFTFRELTPSGDGWITDGRDYRVIVTVTEEDDVLVATLEYPDGFPVFENRYEPTQVSVIISGTKVAIGADLICGMFEFGLFDDEGNLVATTVNGPA